MTSIDAINQFSSISLEKTNQVALMNRIELKYYFHINRLNGLLSPLLNDYFVLEINRIRQMPYLTHYFDTSENKMYLSHHNGMLPRFKLRKRKYQITEMSYLEIKRKQNKGNTIKKRVSSDFNKIISDMDKNFISSHTPFTIPQLNLSLINSFDRITLIDKQYKERCTIDLNIEFRKEEKIKKLPNLVLVEIKSHREQTHSIFGKTLFNERIFTSSFSKYCMGRAYTSPEVKRNLFKETIRAIEKLKQNE